MIKIINEGILYCNQRPGYESIHAHFPFIEQLSKEELICFYSRGSAMTSADKVVAKLRSTDGGNTWKEEGVVRDPSRDDKKFCYYHGAATKLKNGKLIAVLTRFDRSNPDELMWDPETGGYPDPDIVVLRSEDNGHLWSKPEIVPFPEGMIGNHAGTIIELDDKNLMLNFETWKHSGDSEAAKQKSLALISENEGKSWDNVITVADGSRENINYFDQRITKLGNGRLLALFWTHDMKTDKDLMVHRSISDDNGRTWSGPEPTNINGAVTYPVKLDDGRLLAVYVLRHGGKPGIMAALSDDEGKSWDLADQVRLWDASGRDIIGIKKEGELEQMLGFAFGMPHAKLLSNGDIMSCFWCTSASITHIRWCRLRVE